MHLLNPGQLLDPTTNSTLPLPPWTWGHSSIQLNQQVVIVGNGAVGKSSLIQRYCRGTFTKGYKKTIGVDFLEKHLRISGEDVRLMLWDTAGQEEFDAITKAYYRGAQACVVAFSTIDRSSFEAVKKWKTKVEDECGGSGSGLPMVLVQNKIDLMHQSAVSTEEVDRLAKEFRMRVYRTSVKEDINVGNVFQHLAENYVHQWRLEQDLMRFDIGGPRSLMWPPQHHQQVGVASSSSGNSNTSGNTNRSSSASPNEADRSCNGSTASSNGSTGSVAGPQHPQQQQQQQRHMSHSVSSSGYFSLTDFGPPPSLRPSRSTTSATAASASNSVNSGYLSPQDYLNNPMFDSLNNASRGPKLSWSIGDGSGDRTITLKPLANVLNPKKRRKSTASSLQRKFGVNSSSMSSSGLHNHHFHHRQTTHRLGAFPPPQPPPTKSNCKVI